MAKPEEDTLTFKEIVAILEEEIDTYERENPYEELDFHDYSDCN